MPWQDIAIATAIALGMAASLLATRYREWLAADEAYLWYGVLRLRQGEVPQRDFRAYEPGRYLWCGLFALAFGPSLGTVRLATHAFYGLCLAVALVTFRQLGLSWLDVSLVALLLAAWALPMCKLYEPGLLFLGFSASTWLVLFPSPLTAALVGGVVGVALLFGFNYFLYLGAALVLLFVTGLALTSITLPAELFGWAVFGGFLGLIPFAAFLVVPGFLRAFIQRRVTSILSRGSTNLPLPVPWPWRPAPLQLLGETRIRQLTYSALFVLLPVAPVLTFITAWLSDPVSARLLGAVVAATLGAVCWHHAYSRADPTHLLHAMPPLLLIAALVCTSPLVLAILVAASIAFTWTSQPAVERRLAPQRFKRLQFGRVSVLLTTTEHRVVESAIALSRRELADGGSLLALPWLLTLYPILGRRAPVYDIYSVFPASQAEQERMLTSMEQSDVRLAFIADWPLDGRDELRFSNTHPLVWRHLVTTMERVEELPGAVHVFRRRAHPTTGAPNRIPDAAS